MTSDDDQQAVIYVRLSQRSNRSIDDQIEDCTAFAAELDYEVTAVYNDGQRSSGFTEDRPKYREMLNAVRGGEADAIFVRDRARLSRNKYERMALFAELRDLGVDIYVAEGKERVKYDGAGFIMEAVHAHGDDDKKREEMSKATKAIKKKVNSGFYHGDAPMGTQYTADKRALEANDDFKNVMGILAAKDAGRTHRDVAEEFEVSTGVITKILNRRHIYEHINVHDSWCPADTGTVLAE